MTVKLYKISGMTCQACARIVHDTLSKVPGLNKVEVDLPKARARIEMEQDIPLTALQAALADSLYQIAEDTTSHQPESEDLSEKNKALIAAYLSAAGRMDYESLPQYLAPDFTYQGAIKLGSAHDYVEMIKEHANSPASGILLRFDIKAIFADENDCCAIYDAVSCFAGKQVSFAEQIKVKDHRIASSEVKFNRHQMKQLMQEVNNRRKRSNPSN